MKKAQIILLPVLAIAGLLAGGLSSYLRQADTKTANQETAQQENILQTDSFSLKLFQQVLQEQKGNVMVVPHTISNALLALLDIAAGKTREELEALQLTWSDEARSFEPFRKNLLAVDINLPRTAENFAVLPLRFSEDLPGAMSFFNATLAQGSPDTNAQFVTSDMVSPRTRLLIGAVAYCNLSSHLPFHAEHSRMDDFDSANGAMPRYHQMRSRGLYSTAIASDGSWQAIALTLIQRAQDKSPLVLIGILPAGSARQFAESLTPERLTNIRGALATATPEDTLVEFPRLALQIRPYDMRYTLRRLGLTSLFDTSTADFSPLTPDKIHLNAVVHASGVTIAENRRKTTTPASELEQAKNSISFSRPFLWIVADLSTNTPLEYIGLVEEM